MDDADARTYEEASRDFWQHLSTRTVERLDLRPGQRVLDAPCGTGPSLLAAAAQVGSSGFVVGLDHAEPMLAIARDKVRAAGLTNVELRFGDMTALEPPDPPFDAVVCVLGIFFVADMESLVRSFLDVVRPGGRVAVTVFGERFFDPMRDVFVEAVHAVAPSLEVAEPWRRTDRASALSGVLAAAAGAARVTVATDDDHLPLASPDDWWRIVTGTALAQTMKDVGEAAAAEVRARCDAHVHDHGVREVVVRSRYAVAVRA